MANRNLVNTVTQTVQQLVIGTDHKQRTMSITLDASSDYEVGTALSVDGATVDSGTTDGSTTAYRLIQSGQNFETTVSLGDLIKNTTDSTYAFVLEIISDTELLLDRDIMETGENYTIHSCDYAVIRTGQMPCVGLLLDKWEADSDTPTVKTAVLYAGKVRSEQIYDPTEAVFTHYIQEGCPGIDIVDPTFYTAIPNVQRV